MDGNKFARRGIMDMAPYVAGKPVEEVEKEYGIKHAVKLASNENPLKTSPAAVAAMQKELQNVYMYPEGSSPLVRERLARAYGIDAKDIVVGAGGDHVIGLMCQAFVNEGDEVIVGKPTFKTYELQTIVMGGVLIEVPLKDFTFDLEAIYNAITEKTKLIFLCNPNNPTSTIVKRGEVESFIKKVPDHCIVVFDEAYREYISDPDYPNGLEYIKQGRNVMVVRTFSKIYGLAGNRIGYGIAPPHLADVLGRVLPAFPAGRLAQVAAVAAFDDTAFLAAVKRENDEGRAYLCAAFDEMCMSYPPSYGNYIWVDTGMDAGTLNEALLRRGFIIRPGTPWGYTTTIRVSIGTMDENKGFINALREMKEKEHAKTTE
ncbi:MAG: histidinol-phosphate transaminase [Clostridiales bacterium]|jgi:histidinol-phosphate aminotransferase|nr:histidinol-phosphate transaminase [Clostridiales bacterium]